MSTHTHTRTHSQVLADNVEEMNEVCMRFEACNQRAMEKPKESHEMKALKQYLESTPKELAALQKKILNINERMNFLHTLNKEVPDEDMLLNTKTYMWPEKIQPVLEAAMERVLSQEERMEEGLRARQRKFEEDVSLTTEELRSFQQCGDARYVGQYLQQAVKLQGQLEALEQELAAVNEQEEIFGWNPTVNLQVDENMKELEPFQNLFKAVAEAQNNVQGWLTGSMLELNPEAVESEVDNMWRSAYKFTKQYSDSANLVKLAESMKTTVGGFKPHVPLITVLCNGGLRDRHWEQFAEVVGFSIKPHEKTSLGDMIERKLEPHLTKLEEISESASKEWSLEKNLNKQYEEWQDMNFEMAPYRDSGTSILSGGCVDEIQTILDDQIVKTQTMLASPYIKPFEARAKDWEAFLVITQDVIDLWLKVQAQWLYLEPIFASDDIKKQMPKEAERFLKVDTVFRSTVTRCLENPKALVFTRTEGLLDSLRESFDLLELINKGLNAYLEQKRLYFPRFFFLSNDELLEILAETKDPLRVQPHLKKCFEAVAKLQFDDNLVIHGMISGESELVPWPRTLNPAEARGAVEKWLVETETLMRDAVKDQTAKARQAYPETPREKWVLEWPGMTAICVGQMFWTSEVEESIQDPSGEGVRKYAQKCTDQLDDMVGLVRGNLTKLQRSQIGALVVLDVHSRDMTVNLADEGISSILDFSWLAQLRYYWESDDVQCKMITACIKYGYEYLGVSSRLVVTPLTDRCVVACFCAWSCKSTLASSAW
jgi:dynein heavy chain